jgi:hypothetical protein
MAKSVLNWIGQFLTYPWVRIKQKSKKSLAKRMNESEKEMQGKTRIAPIARKPKRRFLVLLLQPCRADGATGWGSARWGHRAYNMGAPCHPIFFREGRGSADRFTRLLKDNFRAWPPEVRRAEVTVFQELTVSEMGCGDHFSTLLNDIFAEGRGRSELHESRRVAHRHYPEQWCGDCFTRLLKDIFRAVACLGLPCDASAARYFLAGSANSQLEKYEFRIPVW